jgi:hypothetical protein
MRVAKYYVDLARNAGAAAQGRGCVRKVLVQPHKPGHLFALVRGTLHSSIGLAPATQVDNIATRQAAS